MSPGAKLFWAIAIIAALASAPLTMMPRSMLYPGSERPAAPKSVEPAKSGDDSMLFRGRR